MPIQNSPEFSSARVVLGERAANRQTSVTNITRSGRRNAHVDTTIGAAKCHQARLSICTGLNH